MTPSPSVKTMTSRGKRATPKAARDATKVAKEAKAEEDRVQASEYKPRHTLM